MEINRDKFKNQEKKLKRHYYEQERLDIILNHIKLCDSYNILCENPITKQYGFEALKHDLSGKYSFRLSKNGGLIRLIVSIDKEYNIVYLNEITMKHYEERKRK